MYVHVFYYFSVYWSDTSLKIHVQVLLSLSPPPPSLSLLLRPASKFANSLDPVLPNLISGKQAYQELS